MADTSRRSWKRFYTQFDGWRHRIWPSAPGIAICHVPQRFPRRAGDFTANICGRMATKHQVLSYMLNDGPWLRVGHAQHRARAPWFTIELPAAELDPGENWISLRARYRGRSATPLSYRFDYDPLEPDLPSVAQWRDSSALDVQDGLWEVFTREGESRVRPVSGREMGEQLLAVCGAFATGRRVRTDLVYHGPAGSAGEPSFGVVALWGGHPDNKGGSPRRGRCQGLVRYRPGQCAVGLEFATRFGGGPAAFLNLYRGRTLEKGRRYRIVAEAWSGRTERQRHRCYRQRMKWWPADEPEPRGWLELSDRDGAPLPENEYGVALVSAHCQVDFGPVHVDPLFGDPG